MACEVVVIDGQYTNPETVQKFVNIAKKQKDAFRQIFPWEISLKKRVVMIIASTNLRKLRSTTAPSGFSKICGWLTAFVDYRDKSCYISELSSRSVSDKAPEFRGVAYRLYQELITFCQKKNLKYIYLYPLNDVVKSIYEKWGLQPVEYKNVNTSQVKKTTHMFYQLDLGYLPNNRRLDEMSRPSEIDDFETIAEYLTNSNKTMLESLKINNKNMFDDIVMNLEALVAICEDGNTKADCIQDYIQNYKF